MNYASSAAKPRRNGTVPTLSTNASAAQPRRARRLFDLRLFFIAQKPLCKKSYFMRRTNLGFSGRYLMRIGIP